MKKTVFIGSVLSSKIALETLIENGISIDLVCSLDEAVSKNVSDYYPIHELAEKHNINYVTFRKITEDHVMEQIKEIQPDFLFVIGISQIIPANILSYVRNYAVGFHPTPLPKHRGRAALPWQIILGIQESKVSLFKLDEGMDSGDIINQHPYVIKEHDYAEDVYHSVCTAMKHALQESLESIYNENVAFIKQKDEDATYLLIRRPEDGKIDWSSSSKEIYAIIRGTSKPYPGAFVYYKDSKVIIWKAKIETNTKYIGIPGQIAWITSTEIGVITKDSILVITDYELHGEHIEFTVGHKFK